MVSDRMGTAQSAPAGARLAALIAESKRRRKSPKQQANQTAFGDSWGNPTWLRSRGADYTKVA